MNMFVVKDVNTGFNCIYTNADSLSNKLDELKVRLSDTVDETSIIGITEVCPKNTCRFLPTEEELQIPGFEMISNISERNCRGVALYIKSSIGAVEHKMNTDFKESVWAKVKLSEQDKLLIGCVYRSPNSDDENTKSLYDMLKSVSQMSEFSHILIMGDFNYPKIDWSKWISENNSDGEDLIECIRDCFFYQHSKKPTRARNSVEPSILDLIMTNEEEMVQDICIEVHWVKVTTV